MKVVAILVSIVAAVTLAYGANFQNAAFDKGQKHGITGSLSFKNLKTLLTEKRWLGGFTFVAAASVLQVIALTMAPLIVVQPVGAIALVITALLNARSSKTPITRNSWIAMALCTFGIGAFVIQAAGVAKDVELNDASLLIVLGLLIAILVILGVSFFTFARKAKALAFIIGAGVLYGFVASLMKVVVQRIIQGDFEWLTVLCGIATIGAVVLGGWFVQSAYASGPPDLVIAGLTVIDPMVGVSIGIIVLGEAQQADLFTMVCFSLSGVVAVVGVWLLSKVHPELAKKA
ncbi:MAG: DMT family transporter [Rhodoluna sp.]|nr:DMT family transporter [Rhodoluna sp.]